MKTRHITLLLIAMISCISVQAQHNPLKNVKIADFYISQSGSEKSYNIGNTREIYSSYFHLGSNRVEHHRGIKDYDIGYDLWTIHLRLTSNEAIAVETYTNSKEELGGLRLGQSPLYIIVGGVRYAIKKWYYSPNYRNLMVDISKPIAEHMAISGLQAVCADDIGIISFNDIDQELWRRAAKDVYEQRKHL